MIIGGEITTKAKLDYDDDRARGHPRDRLRQRRRRVPRRPGVHNLLVTQQSPDIAQGVDAQEGRGQEDRQAGRRRPGPDVRLRQQRDAGADAGADHVCAPPRPRAHQIRKSGNVPWLRPDAKSQVSVVYENDKPVAHLPTSSSPPSTPPTSQHKEIEKFCIENVVRKVPAGEVCSRSKTEFLINPTGRFVVGGPQGDTGLTGRKIIVDTYGGMGRHGGGAFSGKDPTKVDRSAAYMGRWVAKNIVAAKLAARCEVQFAYAIGHPRSGQRPHRHLRHRHGGRREDRLARSIACSASSRPTSSSS